MPVPPREFPMHENYIRDIEQVVSDHRGELGQQWAADTILDLVSEVRRLNQKIEDDHAADYVNGMRD
jgi:hypothetical protein